MKRLYAGKLDGKEDHYVRNGKYVLQWYSGDAWRIGGYFSSEVVLMVSDGAYHNLVFKRFIETEEDIKCINELLWHIGFHIHTDKEEFMKLNTKHMIEFSIDDKSSIVTDDFTISYEEHIYDMNKKTPKYPMQTISIESNQFPDAYPFEIQIEDEHDVNFAKELLAILGVDLIVE